jgi:hypothetical protein
MPDAWWLKIRERTRDLRTMRHPLRSVLTLACLFGFGHAALAVDLYVLSNNTIALGSASTDFGRIDSKTGTYTSIASLSGDVWNLAWNPSAGNFFTTTNNIIFESNLSTLTTGGALSSPLGAIGQNIYGMAYRTADSTLYAYDFNFDDTGTINTANGAWTVLNTNLGIVSSIPPGGRYSIMNDIIYFAGSLSPARFGTMGYTASSTFQSIATNETYRNMVLANDGTTMYGVFGNGTAGQQQLYTIDVATGALTAGPLISGAGLGTFFHGAATTVPEPSTYALGAIASVTMAWLARRRNTRSA